jgi:hypothetical protein
MARKAAKSTEAKPKATVATGEKANDPAQVGAMSDVREQPDGTSSPVGPTLGQPQVGPDDLQAQAVAPRVATIVGNRQYSTGDGFAVGQTASSDLFLDTVTNKVVTKAPERGKVLAIKGEIVQPVNAEQIAYYQALQG